jgi:hypothetical protein
MPNEHTEYTGEVDVPVEAIQVIDSNVVASRSQPHSIPTVLFSSSSKGN